MLGGAALLLTGACACGGSPDGVMDLGGDADAAQVADAIADGDAGVEMDAAPDAGPDSGPDASGDVGPDADASPLWVIERPQVGEPLSAQEVHDFTLRVTGMWKKSGYFRWLHLTSHGLDASNPQGQYHYALWWQDTKASKLGDVVTWTHTGRADNLTLRTCKVLNNAIAGYLMFGDPDLRWVVEEYSRGLVALSKAMMFGDADPVPYLQARAVFSHDHTFETVGGRKVAVDYGPVRHDEEAWNASIVHNPENPTWGDIWLVNQRSKDDVPHMFRTVPALMRVAAEAPDASVREAATEALEYLRGFAADIVASGYQIRTKFADGVAVVPTQPDNGAVKDLASFVLYEIADPNAECNAKLGSALVSDGTPHGLDCEQGSGGLYEVIAAEGHYFNYAIIRYFHLAALANAIAAGQDVMARELMLGLAARADAILHDPELPHRDDPVWDADAAAFLLAAGASGLPLTHEEARLVRDQYTLTAEHYEAWPYWDPWADSVPDGAFPMQPDRGVAVRPTEIAYLLEYCASPLRSAESAPLVDCDIVADPSRWGGEASELSRPRSR
ncbi:MAG: hypothetical protein H6746_00430 [Deltaproteobacteria bacterium]|nr:hypothetical protein [Deltaproteobacteria bacterium]